jgi:malonyl-CoA/methylmalonyl-CoA synthetase
MSGESLKNCFNDAFLARGEKKAITFLRDGKIETEISYFELNQDSNRLAHNFHDRGVSKGDRVILFIQKSAIFVVADLALQKIGAIAVPLNPGFKKSELEYLLQDAEAKLALSEPENEKLIKEIDPNLATVLIDTQKPYQELNFFRDASRELPDVEIKPDDPGLIVYTSGTTGKPKGAILTHSNLVHDARNIINIWEITESDVLCHALPFFHVHGLCFALHTSLMAGSQVVLLPGCFAGSILTAARSRGIESKPGTLCLFGFYGRSVHVR